MPVRGKRLLAGETVVLLGTLVAAVASSEAADWQPAGLVLVLLGLAVVSDLLALQHKTQRISGAFFAIVLAIALCGPAPGGADRRRLRARRRRAHAAGAAQGPDERHRLHDDPAARRARLPGPRAGHVDRDRELHVRDRGVRRVRALQRPQLRDDRRCHVDLSRHPDRQGDPHRLPPGRPVRAGERTARRERRGAVPRDRDRGARSARARRARVPVPAARAAALAAAGRGARRAAARRAGEHGRHARDARPHDRAPLGRGRALRPRAGRGARLRARRAGPRPHRGPAPRRRQVLVPGRDPARPRAAERGGLEDRPAPPGGGRARGRADGALRAGGGHHPLPPRALGRRRATRRSSPARRSRCCRGWSRSPTPTT